MKNYSQCYKNFNVQCSMFNVFYYLCSQNYKNRHKNMELTGKIIAEFNERGGVTTSPGSLCSTSSALTACRHSTFR